MVTESLARGKRKCEPGGREPSHSLLGQAKAVVAVEKARESGEPSTSTGTLL